ncbi:hypothetical protein GCM10010411_71420 [Actinomadura fulvescens]|uniref:Uncharacterized protein n=1 Tax=Actinomadura fulvescens TaxID=46160 RepID=A0ABP6CSH6_9ACTN
MDELEVPERVLVAVTPVLERLPDRRAGLPDQLGEGGPPADPEPDRQDVGGHAGREDLAVIRQAVHRKADDHVPLARGAVLVHGRGGDHHPGQVGLELARGRLQPGGGLGAEGLAVPGQGGRQGARAVPASRAGPGHAREGLAPVRPVRLDVGRVAIGAFGLQERRQRLQCPVDVGPALKQLDVDVGDTGDEGQGGVPVHHHVVRALVPQMVVGAELEDGLGEDLAMGERGRRAHVLARPRVGRRQRIRLGAHVDDVDLVVVRGQDVLPGIPVDHVEAQPERVGLVQGTP